MGRAIRPDPEDKYSFLFYINDETLRHPASGKLQ